MGKRSERHESRPVADQGGAPTRLGLIINPNAGRNREHGYDRRAYERALGAGGVVRETPNLVDLGEVLRELHDAAVNSIVVDGGDGTLGAAITEAYHTLGEENLPPFVPLRGGSFNAAARNLGVRDGDRVEHLERIRGILDGRLGGALREKRVRTVRLHDPRVPRDVFGFIFMGGIPYKLDEYIYSLGGTSQGHALVGLGAMLLGGFMGTRLGDRIFSDTPARISVDGVACGCDSFKLVVATTVHRLLPLIAPTPPPLGASEGRFSYCVNFMTTKEMLKRPVRLFFNRYHGDSRHLTGHARELVLHDLGAGFSLDGEITRAGAGPVTITLRTGVTARMWVAEGE
jgi:hypothetical protein